MEMDKIMRLKVALFINTQVWTGSVYRHREERFLDLLNGVWAREPEGRSRFLLLHDVTVHHSNGPDEKLPIAYVNKSTIQLATTARANAARGLGGQPGPKPHPYRHKAAVAVKLNTPVYTLTGHMHCFYQQRARHVVQESQMFLPLTRVEMHSGCDSAGQRFPFVAVNKEYVLSVQDEGISVPTTAAW
jgi:hypothetical protein